jgi:competence protein ComEA
MNIKTIRNYQNKVGKFRTKEDFQKIYGITEEQYNNLEPYIFINQANDPIMPNQIIELNTAEIDELTKLKGIGIYSAEAIVKYRQKLGGFANINQLLEIKTISPENFELFKNNILVDKTKIKTISLNFSEAHELAAHPYLNYTQAKEIIKFRSINGSYQDKNQLLENKILLENNFRKIEPYLKVN